jgi:hypothetical protein
MAHRRLESPGKKAVGVLLVAAVLFFLPLFWSLSQQFTDYGAHIEFTQTMLRRGGTSLSHFVFQYGVALFYQLGLSFIGAATVLSLIAIVATASLIFVILRRESQPWLAALVTFGLLVIGPLSIVTLPEKELYLGYMTPNAYHNPTLVLLKPVALALLMLAVRAFDRGVDSPRWGLVGAAALLSVLSCLTKPSFQICFLPGLGFLTALAIVRREEVDLRLCVLGVAVPSFLTLGWQYSTSFDQVQTSEIFLAPFRVINLLADRTFLKFVLSVGFPALVTAFFFREAVRDKLLMIAWATAAFGFTYAYSLAETGTRLSHGNFLWSGYISVFVLYVACVPILLREKGPQATFIRLTIGSGRQAVLTTTKREICWGLFGLQVISGSIFAVSQMFGRDYLRYW